MSLANLVLLERAVDWVSQDMHERLRAAAAQLCVNGYLESSDFTRIDTALHRDVAAARAAKARAS